MLRFLSYVEWNVSEQRPCRMLGVHRPQTFNTVQSSRRPWKQISYREERGGKRPSKSRASLMDGRELASNLSTSVLLLLTVELPESMLALWSGVLQGVPSHTFFCYTAVLFYSESDTLNCSSPCTVCFGCFTHFLCLSICMNHWNLLVSVSLALGLQMLDAHLALIRVAGIGARALLLTWQASTSRVFSLALTMPCWLKVSKPSSSKCQSIILTSGTSLGPTTTLYPIYCSESMTQYAYYVLFH